MNFKSILPHLAAIAIFFITVLVVFAPEFQGKTLRKGDIVAYQGASQESRLYQEELGRRMNWTGTSFSGMPTYQISTIHEGNLLAYVSPVLRGFMKGGAGLFFIGMVCTYLLLIIVGVNPWLSIAGAIGAVLATNNIILYSAGHYTKVVTIFYLPLVAAGIITAFRGKYIIGGLIFALGMGLAILGNHPQMLYYFGITVPIYGIAKLVEAIKTGELPHFLKAAGALLIGLVLALGAGANNLLPTQEYSAATMRGGQVLETPIASASGSAKNGNGLEWEYAMQWSNGFKDMIATYVPFAAGSGSGQTLSADTDYGKALIRMGVPRQKVYPAPLYHGSLPFTAGPTYLGAVVWALFLFGLFTARKAVAWWLGLGTLLIMFMSAGSNLEGFNRFLYDTLPLLSKFRTPNSALSISSLMMISLGIMGVYNWYQHLETDPEAARRKLLYSGITAAALGAFIALILPAFLTFVNPTDGQQLSNMLGGQANTGPLADALESTRKALYSSDAWRSFLFVGLTYGVLYLLYRGSLSPLLTGLALAALVGFDFSGINARYLSEGDWVKQSAVTRPYQPSAADQQILADKSIHYRVYNVTSNPFNDAATSYFHKNVGGYSAVKMRRYQDLIDGYLVKQDQRVLNMLNTKYYIVPGQDGTPQAQMNPQAFGPAWLVNDIKVVNTNDAEFAALGTVDDLKGTAIVHEEFSNDIKGLQPAGQGSIAITDYKPDALTYTFSSPSEELVVFSEMWYGPDLGWKAYIDGKEAELIRSHYLLRALRVPAGQHEIKMVFEPASYSTGVTLSYICSLLILFGLAGWIAWKYSVRHRLENTATPVETMPKKTAPEQTRAVATPKIGGKTKRKNKLKGKGKGK